MEDNRATLVSAVRQLIWQKKTFVFGSRWHQLANVQLLWTLMHKSACTGGGSFWFKGCGTHNLCR
jgi:hypothetical protein